MNREIKFRYWHKREKRMYDAFLIGSLGHIVDDEDGEKVLMQYTGLKDKNGKEIYEGDVVHDGLYVSEVKWNGWCYDPFSICLCGCSSSLEREPTKISERDEIIGSIYENPDLLQDN